jgi:hypothetical protein
MRKNIQVLTLFFAAALLGLPAGSATKAIVQKHSEKAKIAGEGPAVLWREPSDIATRDLFYGPGGEKHQPRGPFTFESEDLDGTNPKFVVRGGDGVKWKVKLGEEARPETAASRIVWGVGYMANEDYFLQKIQVENLPRLHRGRKLMGPGGAFENVRLKRHLKGEEKVGTWQWREDPFTGKRELNGLRVVMALINNWDLKDENNSVYELKQDGAPEQIYMVSDLGASFGTNGRSWTRAKSKGNLAEYRRSGFIRNVTSDSVDFYTPAKALIFAVNPKEYFSRRHLVWIGRDIPRGDARWMGELLGRLSSEQIRDAFRAACYSLQDVEAFTSVVEARIGELKKL